MCPDQNELFLRKRAAQEDRPGGGAAARLHEEDDVLSAFQLRCNAFEIIFVLDRLAVHFEDDLAFGQPDVVREGAGLHILNDYAAVGAHAENVHPWASRVCHAELVECIARPVSDGVVLDRPRVHQVDVLILEHARPRELARELVPRVAPARRVVVCPDHVRRSEVVDVDGEEVEQIPVARTGEAGGADAAEMVRMVADLDALEVRACVQRIQ